MLIPAILAALSLAGLIVSFTAGLVREGMDGFFIVVVCLIAFVCFSGVTLSKAAKNRRLPLPARLRRDHR